MSEAKRHTVLVVDDNPKLLKLGQAIFETGGYDVITATDGQNAIDILAERKVALIVTDILMPNMDGYSLCYNLRNTDSTQHIPIIIYSATYTSKGDEQLALDIGADMFIRKPAPMRTLLNAALELIDRTPTITHALIRPNDLTDVMRQYSSRLIEKLEEKNERIEKAHADLVKSEKYFRALIENIFDAISLHNEQGEIIYQSPATERITGYTFEETKGMHISSFFHHDDILETLKRLEKVQNNPGVPFYGVRRMKHKDGRYIWTEGTSTNMLLDDNVKAIVANFRDITERKLAEEKILHANRLYSFISQINQTIVHATDEQTVFDEACRIATEYGKFKVAIIRKLDTSNKKLIIVAQRGLSPEDASRHAELYYDAHEPFLQILETGISFISNDLDTKPLIADLPSMANSRGWHSCMILPIKKDGEIYAAFNVISGEKNFFDSAEISLLEESAGDISFALGVFEKEKHRREMKDKMQHSELRLKQAQAIAHVGSWEINMTTGNGVWSEECCRIHGMSADDCDQSYDSWLSFIHPEDLGDVLRMSAEGERTASSFSFFYRIIRKDGQVRYVFSEAHFECDDKGRPVSIYGVTQDITEIKEAENALTRSESNLRMIMDLMPQCIFARDMDGRYIYANKNFAALFDLTPEQVIGLDMRSLFEDQDQAEFFVEQDLDVIRSGRSHEAPATAFTHPTGKTRLYTNTKVPFTIAATNQKGVLGIAIDITEQKNAETERAKMVAEIIQRNKDLEQFSYIVSHNLRAPVANISGLTGLLDTPGVSIEEKEMIIGELAVSAGKLDGVIKDLNYILQVRKNETQNNEKVTFSELLDDIKLSITHLIEEGQVQIISDFSAIDEMLTIRSYLYSIFLNLLTNSIKYRQSMLAPVINISSSRKNDKIIIIFSDNCLGIDLEKRKGQVFGLYKRFHDHVPGKGMGLYMVKTQVDSLGGKIFIDSEVNKGTTFTLEFEAH